MTPLPRTIAGHRLVTRIGSGAEGEVWEARDSGGRRRALKLVRPDSLVDADSLVERTRWLVRIDHPALVRVLQAGRLEGGGLDGWGFVVMEHVAGRDLDGAGPDPDALDRLTPLAEALDLLHTGAWSDGVPLVHRDIKPANLIARDDGSVVLVDVSTLRGVDASILTRIGTPVYAAPEVATGRTGPPADVYSFAATVVALLTGARHDELAALLEEPGSLDLPAGLRAALSSNPGERPASCRSVLHDLEEWAETSGEWVPGEWVSGEGRPGEPGPSPATRMDEPDSAREVARRRAWMPWAGVLAALVLAPLAVAAAGWPDEQIAAVAVAAYLGHLVAAVAGGEPLVRALVVPPLSWAFLLADRAGGRSLRRRAYARAVSTAVLALAAGATWAAATGAVPAVAGFETDAAQAALAVAGLSFLVLAGSLHASRAGGVGGDVARLGFVPLWLLGACLLIACALLLLLPAAVVRRGRRLSRFAAGILAGGIEIFRRPAPG